MSPGGRVRGGKERRACCKPFLSKSRICKEEEGKQTKRREKRIEKGEYKKMTDERTKEGRAGEMEHGERLKSPQRDGSVCEPHCHCLRILFVTSHRRPFNVPHLFSRFFIVCLLFGLSLACLIEVGFSFRLCLEWMLPPVHLSLLLWTHFLIAFFSSLWPCAFFGLPYRLLLQFQPLLGIAVFLRP